MMGFLSDFKIRLLQSAARILPGGTTLRVWFHRQRGVKIGKGTFISTDVIFETAHPELITIGENCFIGIRTMIIAHNHNWGRAHKLPTVRIEDEVYIGPGCIILPMVTIGRGSVLAAGSVLTHSVPAGIMMQGNPARAVAKCGVPLAGQRSYWEFLQNLKPL